MKDKKNNCFKDIIIVILLLTGIVFGYLSLINGRYEIINRENGVYLWDKWNRDELISTDGKKIDVFKDKN